VWRLINHLEYVFISVINKDFFEFGEENITGLSEPVHQVLIKTLLGKSLWACLVDFLSISFHFFNPGTLRLLESPHPVMANIHSGFVVESLPCLLVKLRSQEVEVGSLLQGLFTGKLHFNSRNPELEVIAKSVMPNENQVVSVQPHQENCLPGIGIVLKPIGPIKTSEVLDVIVEFFLRLYKTQVLCFFPP